MKRVRAQLFGHFEVVCNDNTVDLPQPRLQSLLAYLLLTHPHPQPRQHLAFLIWPDTNEKQARTNLRNLLFQLSNLWQDADHFLVIERNHLGWQKDVAISVDVAEFLAATQPISDQGDQGNRVSNSIENLQRASTLYRGDLMPKLFDEWVITERQRLRGRFLAVLDGLVTAARDQGQLATATAYAEELLQLDPLREESYRRLMQLYSANGDRARALQTYQQCVAILRRELEVEPGQVTTQLYQRLLAEGTSISSVDVIVPSSLPDRVMEPPSLIYAHSQLLSPLVNFPAQPMPLVGRTGELSQVVAQLVEPDCRLLTLMGVGGQGKTRLACAAAELIRTRAEFADGIYFVGLAALTAPSMIFPALAATLGLMRHDQDTIANQVLHHLHGRHLLLVLDNYEHLLPDVEPVTAILEAAPHVRLLVTSRAALNLRAEIRFEVLGLSYPTRTVGRESKSTGGSDRYEAVDLFMRVANRIRPELMLTEPTRKAVERICQLVEGSPLALEMAAGWTRLYDCDAILHQIEQDIDFLVAQTRDSSRRHHSLRAVLEQSWQLLARRERRILAQLTCFVGGFSAAAAMTVTGATPLQLATLLDNTFLQRNEERFDLHELVRRFAAEKLQELIASERAIASAPLPLYAIHERHARFYLGLLAQQTGDLFGRQPNQTVRNLLSEFANLRAAWRWATEDITSEDITSEVAASENAVSQLLMKSLLGFVRLYDLLALFHDAEEMLAQTLICLQPKLQGASANDDLRTLYAQILLEQAEMLIRLAQLDRAIAAATEANQTSAWPIIHARSHLLLGRIHLDRLNLEQAHAHLIQALPFATTLAVGSEAPPAVSSNEGALQVVRLQGQILSELGNLHRVRSEFAQALVWQKQAYELLQQHADINAIAKVLHNIAILHWDLWQLDEVMHVSQQVLNLEQQVESQWGAIPSRLLMAYVYERQGKLDRARSQYEACLHIGQTLGIKRLQADCLVSLSNLQILSGDYEQAGMAITQALKFYHAAGLDSNANECQLQLADIDEEMGGYSAARDRMTRGLEWYRQHGYQRGMIHVAGRLGKIYRLLGEFELAKASLEFAIGACRESEDQPYLPFVCIERALLALEQTDYTGAAEFCAEGLQTLHRQAKVEQFYIGDLLLFRGQIVQARLLVATGKSTEAHQLLQTLLERSESLDARAELSYALWKLSGKSTYGESALRLYRQRYQTRPRYEEGQVISELESALPRQ